MVMTSPRPAVRRGSGQLTVLLCDDHGAGTALLRTALGHRTRIRVPSPVRSLDELVAAVEHLEPDVVLVDFRLAGMQEGVRTLTRLGLPVVVMSAFQRDQDAALAAGAAAFFYKGSMDLDRLVELTVGAVLAA